MAELLYVILGGAVGSGIRYGIGILVPVGTGIPWATLTVNLIGSFLLGVLTAANLDTGPVRRPLLMFLGPGLCGGFTTYSAFAVETTAMLERHDHTTVFAYLLLTVVGGILMALLGFTVVRT
jgi:CrcB protein